MKKIVTIAALFALSFATGFTCSKNAPEQAQQAPAAEAPQEQMAAPAESASTDSTSEAPTQPATSSEQAPADNETK
jgi:hypothetical protein